MDGPQLLTPLNVLMAKGKLFIITLGGGSKGQGLCWEEKEEDEEEEVEVINSKGKNSECNMNERNRLLEIEMFAGRIERADCRL
jgi:hypothetical protein